MENIAEVVAWPSSWHCAERAPVFFSDNPHVWRLLVAYWEGQIAEFHYFGGTTPGELRRVLPKLVFTVDGYPGIYFRGWCHSRAAERTFHLDRVKWPVNSEGFAAPDRR